jgi:hypothetical protein
MKKLLLPTLLVIALSASAQVKKDTVATDATPLFSIRDLSVVDSLLQKKINRFELSDYQQVLMYLQQLSNSRVAAYNAANKQPAKKP